MRVECCQGWCRYLQARSRGAITNGKGEHGEEEEDGDCRDPATHSFLHVCQPVIFITWRNGLSREIVCVFPCVSFISDLFLLSLVRNALVLVDYGTCF